MFNEHSRLFQISNVQKPYISDELFPLMMGWKLSE